MTPFQDFSELTRDDFYVDAPADWWVVITDVEGSTRAIQDGRYKVVNMVGASTVAAIVNATGLRELPFVFGGDGSSALIPPGHHERVRAALAHSRDISERDFGLRLRIGLVRHSELMAAGASVRVAKFELARGQFLAFFRGTGLSLAESWVKGGRGLLDAKAESLDFDPHQGLSCRWAPLKSERGEILSVLIKVFEDRAPTGFHAQLLREINEILDLDSPSAHPVKIRGLRAESLRRSSRLESSFRGERWGVRWLLNFFFVNLVRVLDWTNGTIGGFNARNYKQSLAAHSDFRKFDETLRMVVDVETARREQLESRLEEWSRLGWLAYGLHSSSTALMTCFVRSTAQGDHVHFIDGGDGGYAMAARALKARLARTTEVQNPSAQSSTRG